MDAYLLRKFPAPTPAGAAATATAITDGEE
jgi:hypothetical protein